MIRYLTTESCPVSVVHGDYDVEATWVTEDTVRLDSLEEPCFWVEFDISTITATPRQVRGRFADGNQVDRPLCRVVENGAIEVSSPDKRFVCLVERH
jgi:hypothetical protein